MLRLAIDTGGTFTDCVLADGTTQVFGKTLSTPRDPARAVMRAIEIAQQARPFQLGELQSIALATTVATNAILERKGARVGLIKIGRAHV